MRFEEQVRWSRKWGGVALGVGVAGQVLVHTVTSSLPAGASPPAHYAVADILSQAVLGVGCVLLLFLGIMRPLHRRQYWYMAAPNSLHRQQMVRLLPMRVWLWVTQEGEDLDV